VPEGVSFRWGTFRQDRIDPGSHSGCDEGRLIGVAQVRL